jgi:hypothetical protein
MLAIVLMSSLPAAAWVLSREQPDENSGKERAEGVAAAIARPATESARENSRIGRIGRETRPPQDSVADIFERQSWEVAAPVQAAPPPVAPPLPFAYIGKVVEDGQETVFLTRQDRSYAVKAGETIDGTYRVEKIAPSSVTFTFLPLRQRQQLATGE